MRILGNKNKRSATAKNKRSATARTALSCLLSRRKDGASGRDWTDDLLFTKKLQC